jgi:glycerol kinase
LTFVKYGVFRPRIFARSVRLGTVKECNVFSNDQRVIMMAKYVGALDQGTTSTRFILFNKGGQIAAVHQLEHQQIFPQAGWVEHNALEIWQRTQEVIAGALGKVEATASDLAALG